nr:MAG TPA: tail assembly chaperone protein [Caudoviricetes sp.]
MTITINQQEYQLATSLRVAYVIQGMNNHQAYTKVFERMGDMTLEEQIGIIYASFKVANPESTTFITQNKFLDAYLDTYNLSDLMEQLQELIGQIMGKDLKEVPIDGEPVKN